MRCHYTVKTLHLNFTCVLVYNDFFDFTEEDAKELLEPTKQLLEKLESLIDN